ncbi:MAG: hypothetical protein R6U98_27310, partial [Pirellulaceae bacterium]
KEVGYLASGAVFLLLSAVVSAIMPSINIPGLQYVELIYRILIHDEVYILALRIPSDIASTLAQTSCAFI